MMKLAFKIVEDAVIDSIFERGWVDQSPAQFLYQAKLSILPQFKEKKICLEIEKLDRIILDTLCRELGDEYDVNVFRLKYFPAEKIQEYDI